MLETVICKTKLNTHEEKKKIFQAYRSFT